MSLAIDNRQAKEVESELEALLEEAVAACLAYEGWDADYEVSLSLVDNQEIRTLNRDYRGKDAVTDVLSFPLVEPGEEPAATGEKLLGDIVISVEKALEQAAAYGHSFRREMAFLTVHSMFHLMGYDHEEPEEQQEMRRREEAVLAMINQVRL